MSTPTVTPENDRLLTQDELAARWQVTVRHLQILRKQSKGPKYIAMKSPRYLLSEIVKFEQENMQNGVLHENRLPDGADMAGVRARIDKKNKQEAQ